MASVSEEESMNDSAIVSIENVLFSFKRNCFPKKIIKQMKKKSFGTTKDDVAWKWEVKNK